MTRSANQYDAVILGGGFYGCCIALYLAQHYKKILLIEQAPQLLERASSNNQARVHAGYHYPRSFMTAVRSLTNYPRFLNEFRPAVIESITKIYAIARYGSKVNAAQFYNYFRKLGAPIKQLNDATYRTYFNNDLVEAAYIVPEAVFDHTILQRMLHTALVENGITIKLKTKVHDVRKYKGALVVSSVNGETYCASQVYSCLYSGLNKLLLNSGQPLLPLKHEMTEMALVQPLPDLPDMAVTMMDGPFFSLMPYPAKKMATLSHVRYTPHANWLDKNNFVDSDDLLKQKCSSNFAYMLRDACRYMPILNKIQYRDSLYEIKKVLERNELDDGRPILFREEPNLPNFFSIVGGKIDNIYDLIDIIALRNRFAPPYSLLPISEKKGRDHV